MQNLNHEFFLLSVRTYVHTYYIFKQAVGPGVLQAANMLLFYIGITGSLTKLQNRFNHKRRRKNLTFCQENCAEQVIRILKPVSQQEDPESCN